MTTDQLRKYLQYVVNTAGNASIADFDSDWEPVGPMLRKELMPALVEERGGKLFLTDAGKKALDDD